jgi:hydroxyquinol 1,2-dioxygenase
VNEQRERTLTDEVVASFAGTDRLSEVVRSLTRHLHAFARDVRLTQAEWEAGIAFLTRTGHVTDERRQEFVLLSDVLGLSMLTVGINAPADPRATASTVFGPFFVEGAPHVERGGDIAAGAAGEPCWVSGARHRRRRRPGAGRAHRGVGGRRRRLLRRAVRRRPHRRAGLAGVGSGRGVRVLVGAPVGLPDPRRRSGGRPARRHRSAPDAPGAPALHGHRARVPHPHHPRVRGGRRAPGSDAVFGVKDSLVVDVVDREPGTAPDGRAGAWCSSTFDIRLGGAATTPSPE